MSLTREVVENSFRRLADEVLALILTSEPTKQRSLRQVFWDIHHNALASLPIYREVFALCRARPAMQEDTIARSDGGLTDRGLDNVTSMFLSGFLLNAISKDYVVDPERVTALVDDACLFLIDGKQRLRRRDFVKGVLVAERFVLEALDVRPIGEQEREDLKGWLDVWIGEFRATIVADDATTVIEQIVECTPSQIAAKVDEFSKTAHAMIAFLRIHGTSSLVSIFWMMDSGRLWSGNGSPNTMAIERAGIETVQLETARFGRWAADKRVLLAPNRALRTALRRFELLSDYDNPDRILDQIIILEALFSDDDKQELAHKLSLRVANFLADEFGARRDLYKTIKSGYNARSKLSHGRELDASLRGIDARVAIVVQSSFARYLEYVQRTGLSSPQDEQQFLMRLDERSLGGPPV